MMRRITRCARLAAIVILAAGCQSTDGTEPPDKFPTGPASVVHLSVPFARLYVGDTITVSADVKDSSGQAMPIAVRWSSSRPESAQVDSSGHVTAGSTGGAWIIATAGRGADSVLLSVIPVFFVWPDTLRLLPGALRRLVAEEFVSSAAPDTIGVTWTSSDASVASIDESGVVTGGNAGTAYIVARYRGRADTGVVFVRPVAEELRFVDIAVADGANCGLTDDGRAYCWGLVAPPDSPDPASRCERYYILSGARGATVWNRYIDRCSDVPMLMSKGVRFSRITFTHGGYPFAIATTGELYTLGPQGATRHAFPGPYTEATGGGYFTCAVRTDASGTCWGSNAQGTLGYGVAQAGGPYPASPVTVVGGHTWKHIDAVTQHACGIDSDGAAWCWGNNPRFRLGIGPDSQAPCGTPCVAAPARVATTATFTQLASRFADTCGLTVDGEVWCWGSIPGAAPAGNQLSKGKPIKVQSPPFTSLSGFGSYSLCGMTATGDLYCIARNEFAMQDKDLYAFPKASFPFAVARIRFGSYASCAESLDGIVYCWGGFGLNGLNGGGSFRSAVQAEPIRVAGQRNP